MLDMLHHLGNGASLNPSPPADEAALQRVRILVLSLLGSGTDASDATRPIMVTPFGGAYGRAGWVAVVQGTPHCGTLLLFSYDRGVRSWPITAFAIHGERSRSIPWSHTGRQQRLAELVKLLNRYGDGPLALYPSAPAGSQAVRRA